MIDFANPDHNDFLAVRKPWIQGPIYLRCPDLPQTCYRTTQHHQATRRRRLEG
ncbi:hypothetical protein [Phormidium sp. FACHB-1136]|uniref:hypothetical protein n=1 Tax=Phormidium sp. FACHB-1136 TaxID=2692848 RepID=UPI001688C7B3|nr:hypothetical protein [Phormidium sp. FACHB-1136]MBD2426611.1 hypothetical protein [Phormidium sp. FACHB-1136]